ncbi:cob(I)yrinic acid a,c-diamide adenosyltransferase [Sulfitobacter mediterraneus]|jgi:cob(I)alamin adenosyltransferase|uniref:cob(I)yrinic acid a,c-diamide adenosyltransferase n=1 Tax=Sulfitobacter TaxID=60136 RepID=UPI001934A6F5|nr:MULTISPECIES: cob(I)yrinic acid a,c-diamide adenosyltransferase [Sulfitobacter]MBM1633080.1 cob(I)yrinic acid a,c-diamide adenosyltransferase [Sulfitobacter mediterraneus]MBM1640786.1 cob(I)yrinic acid a,c-diamide adenosyltransferase [Sulfitobacter mediterraneus]MBM1644945.1 cob(I)yrinic acid a,c-diamide adenosyltransferase [Sulfitobacter mediterraneus]MBM1648906.1 cob(I)yrinic acid a,c-diamide adenosyltransferase [Sulfitobacter mediterraneus]MBM1652927.1 cob(I)yrinic acid a,c-diamide adeno
MSETADHKEKMQKRQAEQRKKVAELQDPEKGLVLVHTGAGKGKTSSAFGVVVRALGWKQRVGVVQFIKGKWKTGERLFFDRLEEVTWHTMGEGFTWDTQDKERDIAAAQAAFAKAREMMESGDYDLVVLDEINIAMRYEYISVEDVIAGLDARAKDTGVILTGRDAKPELCAYADLVTEMTEVKHPFKAGIKAQRGVDF